MMHYIFDNKMKKSHHDHKVQLKIKLISLSVLKTKCVFKAWLCYSLSYCEHFTIITASVNEAALSNHVLSSFVQNVIPTKQFPLTIRHCNMF